MTAPRTRNIAAPVLVILALAGQPLAAAPLPVVIPDRDNLQYMAFFVARGAGMFAARGVETELVVADAPPATEGLVRARPDAAAVLPPPMYARLAAGRVPIVLVANLLAGDPIDLVVQADVAERLAHVRDRPVAERLQALRGLRIGVAPNPPTRLRTLFSLAGMDPATDLQLVTLKGPSQNQAFGEHAVDALYAHTPYLETALLDQGAVMWVDQGRGDVPGLPHRAIHALAVPRALVEGNPALVRFLVDAIGEAQQTIRSRPADAVTALLRDNPALDRRHVEKIVSLYGPAMPASPHITSDAFRTAVLSFPATQVPPDLSGVDVEAYVLPAGSTETGGLPWLLEAAAVGVLLLGLRSPRRHWKRQ